MNKSRYLTSLVAAAALTLMTSGTASAASIKVGATTPFSETGMVKDSVKNECQLETKLPEFVKEYADSYGIEVELTEKSPGKKSKGKVLVLEITGTEGAGGGAWSGAKSVTVKGELFENGKSIGNFMASRYSTGGAFAGFKGTCSIMGRCVKTIGKDIATWLQNPTKNARLGDM